MKQQTLKKTYSFEGKGLHTGRFAHMTVGPAAPSTGIVFVRTDISSDAVVEALAENVTDTSRSTTISRGEVSVHTVEHILSALTGLGVDNARIEIDNIEVPILDGSARFYAESIINDGLEIQDAERQYIGIPEAVEVRDEKSGSFIRIAPASAPSTDVKIDFNSSVLGVQEAHWDEGTDYAAEIAPCRTFVFLHEIEFLYKNGLVKGGDVDNAIVIVEKPVSDEQLDSLCALFNKEKLSITENGYLNNLSLNFNNECGRHKMLDLLGDLRLCGGFLNAEITAYKPGHTINTQAAKAFREALKKL